MLQKLAELGLLGFQITGDIGPYTTYSSARRKGVVFERAPPLNPPTPAQEQVRDFFRDVATWWQSCDPEYRADVQEMANAAGLRITGYNLCTGVCRTGSAENWETVCRQGGYVLAQPPRLWPT